VTTGIFYHKVFLGHNAGIGHPESPERLEATMEFLIQQKVFDNTHARQMRPRAATMKELELIHPKPYIELVKSAAEHESRLDRDTRAVKGSWNAALLAAGAGLKAWDEIIAGNLSNAFGLVRPPGHHANADSARGFCLFNNIAILARYITTAKPSNRVLIIDFDAHHGNGTQEILYDDPSTLYLGLHQDGRTLYPGYSGYVDEIGAGAGKGYNINIPLPPGIADVSYLKALREIFPPLVDQFQPTAILVSAGYDAHFRDYQTNMKLSNGAFYHTSDLIVRQAQKACKGRVIMLLEGGYDLKGLSESIYNTLIPMMKKGTPIKDKPPDEDPRIGKYVNRLLAAIKETFKPWWKL
jgi:acetoin utilization deacetylase AcuC-like enzyme